MPLRGMTARELLAAAEADILEARTRAKTHRSEADAADAEADEREEDARVLRRVIERHEGPDAFTGQDEAYIGGRLRSTPSLRSMNRPDAILALLRRAPEGLSPSAIQQLLIEEGRSDKIQGVRNALTGLKDRGLIRSHGLGDWRIRGDGDHAEAT